MFKKGLVSIIVPCYNGEKYVDRLMRSILLQTYKNIEVLVVNDGSTDNSKEKILNYNIEFAKEGMLLKYYEKENGGLGSAINFALKKIEGEYFTWIGIDDWYEDVFVEKYLDMFNAFPDFDIIRANGNLVEDTFPHKIICEIDRDVKDKHKTNLFENALKNEDWHFGPSMLKTEVFLEENGGVEIYESREGQNWQLLLPVLYNRQCGYIERPLYNIAVRVESVSRCAKTEEKRIKQLQEYRVILLETLRKMPKISSEDRKKAIHEVQVRYSRGIMKRSYVSLNYEVICQEYKTLKDLGCLTKEDKIPYSKRFMHIEYWTYLKHKIFG